MEQVLNIERNLEQGGIIEVIICINSEKIAFENRKSDIVYMSSDIYEINSDYELLGKKQRLG